MSRHAGCVPVGVDRVTAFSAQQSVHRQSGVLAKDVPQGHVDTTDGIVEHRTVSPVGTDEGRLPDVFNVQGVLAKQKWTQVLVDGSCDHPGPLGERGTTEPVKTGLVGVDPDDDQPDSRWSGQDGPDIGDLGIGGSHWARGLQFYGTTRASKTSRWGCIRRTWMIGWLVVTPESKG